MNLYVVFALDVEFIQFSEDGYTLTIPDHLVEYVVAETPGKAKMFVIKGERARYTYLEYIDLRSHILKRDVDYTTGIVDTYEWDDNDSPVYLLLNDIEWELPA